MKSIGKMEIDKMNNITMTFSGVVPRLNNPNDCKTCYHFDKKCKIKRSNKKGKCKKHTVYKLGI